MPRGDGKRYGEPRREIKYTGIKQTTTKVLQARIDEYTEKQEGLLGFHRPGSQRKGNAN